MSFFSHDSTRHNTAASGFSQAHNPFAGLSENVGEGEALEFEDTYDGLGDQLDETDDAFNDDTFGGGDIGGSSAQVGKDFDFFGQTAKVSDAFEEENVRFNRQNITVSQPPAGYKMQGTAVPSPYSYAAEQSSKPARTGYEKYRDEPIQDLQVDAALWGVAPKKQPSPAPTAQQAPSRKVMSLEEVEAQMRAQAQQTPAYVEPTGPSPPVQHPPMQQPHYDAAYPFAHPEPTHSLGAQPGPSQPLGAVHISSDPPAQEPLAQQAPGHPVTILQRPQAIPSPPVQQASHEQPQHHHQAQPQPQVMQHMHPTHILQNPGRVPVEALRAGMMPPQPFAGPHPGHYTTPRQQGSFGGLPPHVVAQLSETDKAAYLELEAKRAKRNHKIYLMSRDNGVMTPQDKNFITRIQLQQLVSAAGNPNERGTTEAFAEDFYYQVLTHIQGGQRQHPSQPLNNFAQTYLYQTGSRHGGMRRHRGPENHMQRMEQQVQRAVEAAKNRPKSKQLVIEGSLGKISFSNAKTPKPLLNIKRNDSASDVQRPGSANKHTHVTNGRDRKSELRLIEAVYLILMKLEDHERLMPPPGSDDPELAARYSSWSQETERMRQKLWTALRVHDSVPQGATHPFIALLSYAKGQKALSRIFRQLDHEQRMTILTLIIVNLDSLDVVRAGQVGNSEIALNAAMRESIELFSAVVGTTILSFLSELGIDILAGILGIIGSRNVDVIAKSRIGVALLTMILSRAEMMKESGQGDEQSWHSWDHTHMEFFNAIEPSLPYLFPDSVTSGEDIYVWHFLAAIGIGASPDQQQRLVLGVKDRVMDTVAVAKTLPQDLAAQRLQSVNLFMRAIGLDVGLLQ